MSTEFPAFSKGVFPDEHDGRQFPVVSQQEAQALDAALEKLGLGDLLEPASPEEIEKYKADPDGPRGIGKLTRAVVDEILGPEEH